MDIGSYSLPNHILLMLRYKRSNHTKVTSTEIFIRVKYLEFVLATKTLRNAITNLLG